MTRSSDSLLWCGLRTRCWPYSARPPKTFVKPACSAEGGRYHGSPGNARRARVPVPTRRLSASLRTVQRLLGFLMIKAVRLTLALAALAAPAVIVAGCGGVPGNAVATVDGNAIDKTAY